MEQSKNSVQYFNSEECIKLKLKNYAVMILNQPIIHPSQFLIPFWNGANIRMTVDGGTNRWFNFIDGHNTDEKILPIDIVTGDFDSINNVNLKKAQDIGAKIISTENQDETDFTKAIRALSEQCLQRNIEIDTIFVICQSSGRIDQIMANINTLYEIVKLKLCNESITTCLFSNDSFTWLLQPGKHVINVPDALKTSKNAWCGLVPIGEKCDNLSTTGLKWNLDRGSLAFGSLVSTSNTYDGSNFVTIENEVQLLWCMGLLPLFNDVFSIPDVEQ
ncbi:thiamine pyrophosphokinase 1-like [Arctopsyche grandis]|uniref:thiamine pyrophosphokinase 1-like n=1 Tax=Arctopsyche grandis TaxID=121162 RepID=UPI00406D6682